MSKDNHTITKADVISVIDQNEIEVASQVFPHLDEEKKLSYDPDELMYILRHNDEVVWSGQSLDTAVKKYNALDLSA